MKRIFFVLGVLLVFSCSKSASTPPPTPPVVSTSLISAISDNSAIVEGTATISTNGTQIISQGVCWSITPSPTIDLVTKTSDNISASFKSSLTGLQASTTYYVRAYATNSAGTTYGSELSFKSFQSIGTAFQGGILAYILSPTDPGFNPSNTKGLIIGNTVYSNIRWHNNSNALINSNILTGATGTDIGTGKSNTDKIILAQGNPLINYAAGLAKSYSNGGYSDWFLPSRDELKAIYYNRAKFNGLPISATTFYWNSTEFDMNTAGLIGFTVGVPFNSNKVGQNLVLPIRSF